MRQDTPSGHRAPLRISISGVRPAFAPRARWVLETMAEALERRPAFVDADADLVYAPDAPGGGEVWIPAQPEAQAFFEQQRAFPASAAHRAAGLTLLFPPVNPEGPVPGDIVVGAFYFLARWDELNVPERDRFGRLPLSASAFARIRGLDLEEPLVEQYIAALRAALGQPEPQAWSVALTHDIDRIRRRTAKGLAGMARRRAWGAMAPLLAGDPWNNIPDLLEVAARRGTAPTVFFIGRNRHRLDGTPRRTYERTRRNMARAVLAAGGEVGLHAAFASSEDGDALAEEFRALRREVGPISGVRFHYLRFRYHETVRWLERAGVEYDTSLGFSEAPGFACGIARPFRPWLVGEERPADLLLLPLAVMDTTLHSHLGLDAPGAEQRALSVLGTVKRYGGRVSLLWHNTYLSDDRAPGYGQLWGHLLDRLQAEGAALGTAGRPPDAAGGRLEGARALHVTSVHQPTDIRIFHKEVRALRRAGAEADVVALESRPSRAKRLLEGWRLVARAKDADADVYHFHDPELLPAALWLRWRTGKPAIYDVHEYLGRTARTKTWLPAPARLPVAVAAERVEQWLASRMSGVVAANPDLAARFANAGARAAPVDNSPWGSEFGEPTPLPAQPRVVYIGGIGLHRGIDLMRAAFPMVSTAGAVLRLVGPGDPGRIDGRVEAIGRVPPEEVTEHLEWCRVAWIPIQATHGNASRPALPTKLIEAMAAGRPVVASDVGLIGQVVRETGCGFAVPPDDPKAHAEAIMALLDGPLAVEMGRRGRAAFLERFGFEHQADRLVDLYREVLQP
jgi:glycosyltransferase involved in cell wall biosynthesis